MADSLQRSFIHDKQIFFNNDNSLSSVKNRAKNKFRWTDKHLSLLEHEFSDLFAALKSNKQNPDKYWLYCYYCSCLLHYYYLAYGKKNKAKEYQAYCNELEKRDTNRQASQVSQNNETFFGRLNKKIISDISELVTTPLHAAKIKDWAAVTNITRLQVVFARLTLRQSLNFLNQSHLLEKLFHTTVELDGLINQIDKTASVLNALSIGVFAVRFTMDAGTLLKHVVLPTKDEAQLGLIGRFKREFKNRHCRMLSDCVWGTVNALTNYAPFFHIPAPVANWTIVGFLLFDLSLLFYRRFLEESDYLAKKNQYVAELKNNNLSVDEKKLLKEQLQQLEIRWQATNATFWLNITAGLLLMSGFSASLFLGVPAAVPACFLVCTVAMAMCISAESFGAYKEKQLTLKVHQEKGVDTDDEHKALTDARNQFLLTVAKNTVVPMVIMGTFAVSWQAALLLTVAYIGLELSLGYLKYAENNKAAPAMA